MLIAKIKTKATADNIAATIIAENINRIFFFNILKMMHNKNTITVFTSELKQINAKSLQ